jgi:hypothetical protein
MKLFFAILLLGATACSSGDVGPTPSSEGGVDSGTYDAKTDVGGDAITDASSCKLLKPYSSKNVSCNQCAETKCCAEINGCLGDPKCDDDYVNCILACALLPDDAGDAGISSCLAQCAKDSPQGKAEYDVAIGCAESKCATECK